MSFVFRQFDFWQWMPLKRPKSGHPGMPMGMAPAAYTLWTKYLKFNPANSKWHNRDRFVLSAGHGSMLLYSLLYLTGYPDMTLDQIKNFRQFGSKTPGHPEYGFAQGVEVTTGPLGQGISNSVGMAIAEKYLSSYFNREGFPCRRLQDLHHRRRRRSGRRCFRPRHLHSPAI